MRQFHVAWLALALGLWMVAIATHVHSDEVGKGGDRPVACSFCISVPAGGAAPALPSLTTPVFTVTSIVQNAVDALVHRDIPSFYSSRAPPAR